MDTMARIIELEAKLEVAESALAALQDAVAKGLFPTSSYVGTTEDVCVYINRALWQSCRDAAARRKGPLVQRPERRAHNATVPGSSPGGSTT
jgi:hypothetical protein